MTCKECPNAQHGFDRNASHKAGDYVCICESFECGAEKYKAEIAELRAKLAEAEKSRDALFELLYKVEEDLIVGKSDDLVLASTIRDAIEAMKEQP